MVVGSLGKKKEAGEKCLELQKQMIQPLWIRSLKKGDPRGKINWGGVKQGKGNKGK